MFHVGLQIFDFYSSLCSVGFCVEQVKACYGSVSSGERGETQSVCKDLLCVHYRGNIKVE